MTAVTDYSKQPVYLVKMYIDVCSNTFGVAPCTASGTKCWYSFTTCKDKTNYAKAEDQKVLRFSEKGGPLILKGQYNIKPLILSVTPVTTEIDPERSVTLVGRYDIKFAPDYNPNPLYSDKGSGNYNTSTAGEFWKNLDARNENLKRRPIEVYEGFSDATSEADFTMRFRGTIENIKFDKDKACIITAKDILAQFSDMQIPNAISSDNVLAASCSDDSVVLQVTDPDEFQTYNGAGTIRITDSTNGNEYITFTGASGDYLTGCTRGAYGTTAASHSAELKLTQMAIFCESDGETGIDPVTISLDIIQNYLEIPAAYVNDASFTTEATTWLNGTKYRRFIDRPTKAETLLQQLRRYGRFNIWVDESGVIQCKAFRPPLPADTVHTITAANNIKENTPDIDEQKEDLFTRLLVYHTPDDSGKDSTDIDDYSGLDIQVDAQRESSNDLGFVVEKKDFCPWIYRASEAKSFASRFMRRFSYPPAKYSVTMEKQNASIAVGDLVNITSDDFLGTDGIATAKKFEVTKKTDNPDGTIDFEMADTKINRRYLVIGPNTMAATYDTATEKDKEYGYIGTASADGLTCTVGAALSEDGYYIW